MVHACVCLAPQCSLHTPCPHSSTQACGVLLACVYLLLVWVSCDLCCLCGHCKVVTGCSICQPFYPFLQHCRGLTPSVQGLPQALSATVLPVSLWTFLLRCRSRPYTLLFLMGIGFQLEPVRSPQACVKWGLVTVSLSILLHPSLACGSLQRSCVHTV